MSRLDRSSHFCCEGVSLKDWFVVVDVAERQLDGDFLRTSVVAAAIGGHHLERVNPLLFTVKQSEITQTKNILAGAFLRCSPVNLVKRR